MYQFFNELKLIYNKYKLLNGMKSDFNIFYQLLNPYDEVNLHSKLIYSILNDCKFKKEFMLSFLNTTGIISSDNVSPSDLKIIDVEREKYFPNGRMDLFFSCWVRDKKYVIIIENKIFASDQYEQIDRYIEFANQCSADIRKVFYLTLLGNAPSEDSASNLDQVNLISYKNEILTWIENCIKISTRDPALREVLIQYSDLLEKITGKDVDYTMDVMNFLLESPENFNMANSIQPAIIDAKTNLQMRFWTKLEESLDKMFKNFPGLNYRKTDRDENLGSVNPWYSKTIIKNYYNNMKNSSCYGVMYYLYNRDDLGDLCFKIEYNKSDSLFYGLTFQAPGVNIDKLKSASELKNKLASCDYKFSNWWFGWKYLKVNEKYFDFINMDPDLVNILMDEDKLNDLIKKITTEVETFIHIILD
ncbi:PD-(D/E)XK nuclease family protein [uncultured Anaerococcus sp.]|uniref:PDDEXK-like family protein n=1 Tax=uncultured Anaerococcus sp. TaxID=293428 RepID=UPI00288A70D6|nr:PD-(D/E)XK nuclease family protein [uncultured Anaerococcus sp.]